jgi:hypothetical protein
VSSGERKRRSLNLSNQGFWAGITGKGRHGNRQERRAEEGERPVP